MRDNEYRSEYDGEFDNLQTAGGGSLRWISMLVMAMVIFGFFSLVFYAYNSSVEVANNELIPTITADGDDYKVKPEDAGGMPIENTDIEAYQLMRGAPNPTEEANQVEKLLPLAERPIVRDLNGTPEVLQGELQKMQNTENNVDAVTTEAQNSQMQASAPALLPTEQKIPQAVTNQAIVNENAAMTSSEDNIDLAINDVLQKQAAQTAAPSALQDMSNVEQTNNQPVPLKPVIKTITAQPTIATQPAPKQIAPIVKQEAALPVVQEIAKLQPVQPKPAPAVVASPKVPPQPKPIAQAPQIKPQTGVSAGTYVQFAAMRSQADAPKVWASLQAKNPELGGYSYYTEAVTLPTGATLYRLRAKGFASRAQALNVCASVKARGQDCLVSAN
jgi:hypothetical protein